LISQSRGLGDVYKRQSLGYKTNIKPDNQIATRAADHHCR
jgi:hypothetical protein